MLGNLLGGFIVILVGVNLVPTVADGVMGARYINGNTSKPTNLTSQFGTAATLLNLIPLFFCLGIMSAGIVIAAIGLKQSGLLG